jgi:hypothetical protein
MKRQQKEPMRRLNLEVQESVHLRIERLRRRTRAPSVVEVVRRALLAYEDVLDGKA